MPMAMCNEGTMIKKEPDRRHRRRRWIALLLLLLIGFGGYGGYRLIRTDPAVKKVRDLRKDLASVSLNPEQRREKFRELRDALQKLPPDKREKVQREMAEEGRKRFEDQLKRYASMSPQEKTQYLDQQIDRMERFRQQRPPTAPNTPGSGSGSVFTSGPGNSVAGVRGPGQAQGSGQGSGNRPSMSAEDREKRRKQRLDETTPEFRALRDQFFKDLQQRRQQRGLMMGTGPGPIR
jgi:hypothetical protein